MGRIVAKHGDYALFARSYELSIIHKDNGHGFSSYGWCCGALSEKWILSTAHKDWPDEMIHFAKRVLRAYPKQKAPRDFSPGPISNNPET